MRWNGCFAAVRSTLLLWATTLSGIAAPANWFLLDRSYAPSCTVGVQALRSAVVLPNQQAYLLGDFNLVNGTPAGVIVRINEDGSLDTSFQLDRSAGIISEPQLL